MRCNMVEDEIHFMCVCSKYNTLRDQLEQTIQIDFPGYKWLSSENLFIYWNPQTRLLTMQLHTLYTMVLLCTD